MIYGKTITNKKRRKRLNTKTILIYGGNDVVTACNNNEIIGKRSLKSAEEVGMDPNEFVHIIESKIISENKPTVIVKIHETGSIYIRKEIKSYNQVKGFENSVQMICDFSCLDDKNRWEHMINTPIKFCNNKKDSLHFIVLEYIENGDLSDFFETNPQKQVLCNFYLQLILSIATLMYKYRIYHGDINSGNILIGKTDKSRMHYRIKNKEYRIQTYGITPKLVDYGRSKFYKIEPPEYEIIDQVFVALSSTYMYIKDVEIKQKLKKYTEEYDDENEYTLQNILNEVQSIF